jgi:hypothetical protein
MAYSLSHKHCIPLLYNYQVTIPFPPKNPYATELFAEQ